MATKKRRNKTGWNKKAASPSHPEEGGSSGELKKARSLSSIARDVGLGLLVCVVFFAAVEIAFRLTGLFKPPAAEDPYVGFSGTIPLFEVKDGIAHVSRPKLRYFNESSFAVQKPPNTSRIFCFGGSTTYGHPFDQRTSFSRWLQELLKASDPEHSYEVINVGGISYASYRIVPLIRETLQYNPDLMIIYTGHNEFLERRTYSQMLDRGAGVLYVKSKLDQLRVYKALERLLEPVMGRTASEADSRPDSPRETQKPILQSEVTAVLDRSAGLDLYHRDDDFAKGVVEHFSHNLRAMITLCREHGVPVILVDPPCNLKDFSPFKSEHDHRMTRAEQENFAKSLRQAEELIVRGEHAEAERLLHKIIDQDPLYADSYYLAGKAALGKKKYDEAYVNFVKAKDLDVCPLRIITPITDRIRQIAAEEKVPLIPFVDVVRERVAQAGDSSSIPGNESFLDHVHPTIELHQVLAELLADQMEKMRLVQKRQVLSSGDKQALYEKIMAGLDQQFMAMRDLNLAKTLKWAGKKEEAREALLRAAKLLVNDVEIHKMLGSFSLDAGDYDSAIASYEKAVALSGHDPEMEFALGVAYYRAGRLAEAKNAYDKILKSSANLPEVYANLGMIYLQEGNVQKAWGILQDGISQCKDCAVLFGPYALAHAVMGRPKDAIPWMQKAVEAEPGDPNNFYNLAGMHALAGSPEKAVEYLNRAVDKGYSNFTKLMYDTIFESVRGRPDFQEVIERIRPSSQYKKSL
jgi:Flp pilus assembly protein TadD